MPFGEILAEAVSDLDMAAAEALPLNDAIERLSLAAHHALLAQLGAHLPRPGLHVYIESVTPPPPSNRPQLDVRF